MRLQRYLTEKWVGGAKVDGETFEVFKNPDKRELRDIDNGNGYRFIIHAPSKSIYFANAEIFHRDMLKIQGVHSEVGLTFAGWQKYWNGNHSSIASVFMGDCESNFQGVNSDVMSVFVSESAFNALPELEKLASYDYSWLKKYFIDPKDVTDIIKETIELLEEKR